MTDTFRKTYRELTPDEKGRLAGLKAAADKLYAYLHPAQSSMQTDKPVPGEREMALARTKLEECVMWAVKGMTG